MATGVYFGLRIRCNRNATNASETQRSKATARQPWPDLFLINKYQHVVYFSIAQHLYIAEAKSSTTNGGVSDDRRSGFAGDTHSNHKMIEIFSTAGSSVVPVTIVSRLHGRPQQLFEYLRTTASSFPSRGGAKAAYRVHIPALRVRVPAPQLPQFAGLRHYQQLYIQLPDATV